VPRQDSKRILLLSERLFQFVKRGREQAETMRPGQGRDDILRKVRQAELAIQVDRWLGQPAAASQVKTG
jgi:hypothetical protein